MEITYEMFEQMKIDLWYRDNELAVNFLERAAIMEFDGNLPRNEAEWQAYHLVVGVNGIIN